MRLALFLAFVIAAGMLSIKLGNSAVTHVKELQKMQSYHTSARG